MVLLAALLAGASSAPVTETIQYRAPEALVVDKDGKPLFRAPRDFLLTVAGNPDGRILAYDPAKQRVLVSEHNPWWISCSHLQPQAVACAQPVKRKTRSITLPPQNAAAGGDATIEPEGRGVPSCPGDPRCPSGN